MSQVMQTILWIQGALLAFAGVGNGIAWLLVVTGHPVAASYVRRVTPFAARLGVAKTAREAMDTSIEAIHAVTTTLENTKELPTPSGNAVVSVQLQPSAPESSALPPVLAAPSALVTLCLGMLFALLTFGCSQLSTVNHAVDVANAASQVEIAAAPFLDEECVAPLKELAPREPSPERSKAVSAILKRCDPMELSYDIVRQLVLRMRALIVAAESDQGARMGDLLDAIEQITKAAGELADAIEQMRRAQ